MARIPSASANRKDKEASPPITQRRKLVRQNLDLLGVDRGANLGCLGKEGASVHFKLHVRRRR
jgi:hypothetical protein